MTELPPSGEPVPTKAPDEPEAWLARPGTIRRLWIALAVALVVLVLAQVVLPVEGHFWIDGVIGFSAWYGFAAAAALVIVAKILALVVKRPDTYYDD